MTHGMATMQRPPVFTEHCICGHRAVDHSLMWWLGDRVEYPGQQIIGRCGRCNDCRAFSYDGPPHESKLTSTRDVWDQTEKAQRVIEAVEQAPFFNIKMHDHPLTAEEVIREVEKVGWPSEQSSDINIQRHNYFVCADCDLTDPDELKLCAEHSKPSEIEIIMPHGMMGSEDAKSDLLEAGLRLIAEAASEDPKAEWAGKYGTNFENDVFTMRPYHPDQDELGGLPANFSFKALDFWITWYKFIGRDMEMSRELPPSGIAKIIHDCLESLSSH